METDALIRALAEDAAPVRPLAAPWVRALVWLALSAPVVFLVVWLHGIGGKPAMVAGDARMMIEFAAIIATAVAAGIAAFASSVPGMSRRWLWLPLVPLAVWIAAIGQGCVADYQAMGSAAFALRLDTECLVPALIGGIVPVAAILVMLRRGAPMVPHVTLALAGLAVAAIVNAGLLLFHAGDVSIMVLVWHVGIVAVVAGLAGLAGPLVLPWRRAAPK